MLDKNRCTYLIAGERCILNGRETPPDNRVLCRAHHDEVIEARINHERRMTRRASEARISVGR